MTSFDIGFALCLWDWQVFRWAVAGKINRERAQSRPWRPIGGQKKAGVPALTQNPAIPKLPRVLLLGDSHLDGHYTLPVREMLAVRQIASPFQQRRNRPTNGVANLMRLASGLQMGR